MTVELLQAMKDNNKAKRCSVNTSSSVGITLYKKVK